MKTIIQKNKKIILIIIVIVVAAFVVFTLIHKGGVNVVEQVPGETQRDSAGADTSQSTPEMIAAQKKINERTDLTPYEKQVELLKVLPLTKAEIEEPLWKGSKEKFKIFKVKITEGGFIPNAIIIEKGDSIQLNMFADKDTDIESADFKLFSPVPARKITNLGFLTNQEGTFTFYCKNQCLGKERIFGHIMVRPRT